MYFLEHLKFLQKIFLIVLWWKFRIDIWPVARSFFKFRQVKVYLLFKPPFLNEQAAIDDCSFSIKTLINLKVNSISINPLNIQKGTLIEYLWYRKKYILPRFYSLFKCLKYSITQKNLEQIRILSDPSGAGTKRGIHNCLRKECEVLSKNMLNKFVLRQDLSELENGEFECTCKKKYQLQKKYF